MTLVATNTVPFFTPVESEKYPLIQLFDSYLKFGREVAVVLDPPQIVKGSIGARKEQMSLDFLATTLKIASMILSLGLLPLLALCGKLIARSSYSFHWIKEREVSLREPSLLENRIDLEEDVQQAILSSFSDSPMEQFFVERRQESHPHFSDTSILEQLPQLLDQETRMNQALDTACQSGTAQEIENLLRAKDEFQRALNAIPRNTILNHYSSLRTRMSTVEALSLDPIQGDQLLAHYEENSNLSGRDLIEKLGFLLEKEIQQAKSNRYHLEEAQSYQEYAEAVYEDARSSNASVSPSNSGGNSVSPAPRILSQEELRSRRIAALTRT